ncbi:MAG: aspartate-semialdehyde dehydrogenase [Lachnospiraceae bacterium]|nr:aspartate-semialdehyde dehydrogenase [Lachnospiraceae bacterium]
MKVAILGATGAVGMQMIKCIEEQSIDLELKLLASKKSAGKKVKVNIAGKEKEIVVEETTNDSFAGMDFVLGAVEAEFSKMYADAIVKAGAIFIDNSSAFRMDKDVPLVVPEINGEDAKNNKGIIANPNCSTIITDMAIYGINKVSKIKSIIASTYQAVSGAGIGGMKALDEQVEYLAKHSDIPNHRISSLMKDGDSNRVNQSNNVGASTTSLEFTSDAFKYQIAYNLIPCIGSFTENDFTTEEMKMQNETRKIMHLPDLKVTCTCIRVPVMRSHSISVTLDLEKKLTVDEVKKALSNVKGVKLVDDEKNDLYPMPLNTTDKDIVEVGRIRKDLVFENGISLFCCGDQIRKGAATNAVQILELFI